MSKIARHKRVLDLEVYKKLKEQYERLLEEKWELLKKDPVESKYDRIGSAYNPTGTEFYYTKSLAHQEAWKDTFGREEQMGINWLRKKFLNAEIEFEWTITPQGAIIDFYIKEDSEEL